MSFESVWGFDPDEVIRVQSLLRRGPDTGDSDAGQSVYGVEEERAARMPPDVQSQILELLRMFAAEEESSEWQES
jgi:hypothetical protein